MQMALVLLCPAHGGEEEKGEERGRRREDKRGREEKKRREGEGEERKGGEGTLRSIALH